MRIVSAYCRQLRSAAMVASLWCLAMAAWAQSGAVITYGSTSLGVNQTGELNFEGLGPGGFQMYGVYRAGVGDAISPGCACEGWGVSLDNGGSSTSTWLNQSSGNGGVGSGNTFGFTSTTATAMVNMEGALVGVRHAFGPSLSPDVFQVQVTITNNGGTAVNDLVYRRVMDWDVPPTEFREYVTHSGVAANLTTAGGSVRYAGNNGFATSDPLSSADWSENIQPLYNGSFVDTTNTDFVKAGPSDHGSVFDFSFGSLAPGGSRIFNIYYGSAPNQASALSKLTPLGVDIFSLGQSSDGNPDASPTFIFAFGGVGGIEPGSTQAYPILPFVPAPGQFTFDAPVPQRWYDPPFATGFLIEIEGGGTLTEIRAPDGFSDLRIYVDGVLVEADFDGGESYTFAEGVTGFVITGLYLDTADASFSSAFPLYLDWDGSVTKMTWTAELAPIPEPGTYGLMAFGLGIVGWVARRRSGHR